VLNRNPSHVCSCSINTFLFVARSRHGINATRRGITGEFRRIEKGQEGRSHVGSTHGSSRKTQVGSLLQIMNPLKAGDGGPLISIAFMWTSFSSNEPTHLRSSSLFYLLQGQRLAGAPGPAKTPAPALSVQLDLHREKASTMDSWMLSGLFDILESNKTSYVSTEWVLVCLVWAIDKERSQESRF